LRRSLSWRNSFRRVDASVFATFHPCAFRDTHRELAKRGKAISRLRLSIVEGCSVLHRGAAHLARRGSNDAVAWCRNARR
jgi:hypothetical protein